MVLFTEHVSPTNLTQNMKHVAQDWNTGWTKEELSIILKKGFSEAQVYYPSH